MKYTLLPFLSIKRKYPNVTDVETALEIYFTTRKHKDCRLHKTPAYRSVLNALKVQRAFFIKFYRTLALSRIFIFMSCKITILKRN